MVLPVIIVSSAVVKHFAIMPGGKCVFQEQWLQKTEFRRWLASVPGNKRQAKCTLCKKVVDIAAMGESALRSHAKGGKHKDLAEQNVVTVNQFFVSTQPSPSDSATIAASVPVATSTSSASITTVM